MRTANRPGMTFVEVLSAAGILIVCCLVLLALLPSAMQTQQMSRYRIYAAASATTMMESFAHPPAVPTGTASFINSYRVGNPVVITAPKTADYNNPPIPGWGSLLRSRVGLGSSFAPDLEQVISRPGGGAIPLPTEIARRLDSDGDEIRQVLDAGGSLFYLDPAAYRGSTGLAGSTDASALAGVPEEFHHLVFAVVSPAQQNVLPANPFQMTTPASVQYPFPPLWQWWYPGIKNSASNERKRQSSVSVAWTSPVVAAAASGDPSTVAGRHNRGVAIANGGISWVNAGTAAIPYEASMPLGEVHGCTWKHLADIDRLRGNTASPWSTGWWAFKRLAGDEYAGWMPVLFALDCAGTPPTYEQLVNYRDRAMFLWMQVMPASLKTKFPAPIIYGKDAAQITSLTTSLSTASFLAPITTFAPTDTDGGGKTIAVRDGTQSTANGYTNANVVAGGLEYYASKTALWSWTSDNDASSPYQLAEFRWVEPINYANNAGKSRLDSVQVVDPYDLPASEFPPHPAQVLALSYLAHASMLVAGAPATTGFTGYRAAAAGGFDAKVTTADLVFARKMHEMSLRWAVAYANERPADWAVPRPDNRPVMTDRPLHLWDLWYDNIDRSATGPAFTAVITNVGKAQRLPRNLGGAVTDANAWDRAGSAPESFYRWIEAGNPNLPRDGTGRLQHIRSGVASVGFGALSGGSTENSGSTISQPSATLALDHWRTRCLPDSATLTGAVGTPWPNWLKEPAAGNDATRWWVDRPFLAQHRARELVYWAVDWKSYEDSEEVPSAPVDFGRTGRFTGLVGMHGSSATATAAGRQVWVGNWCNPINGANEDYTGSNTPNREAPMYGGGESLYAWIDQTRQASFLRTISTNLQYPVTICDTAVQVDAAPQPAWAHARIHLGAYGADRNMNGVFDRGPIPRTQRLRAKQVARFTYYDPVLYLDQAGK